MGYARPITAPISVSDANFPDDIITLTNYNVAGWVFETTDANGNVTASFYDAMGWAIETIAAYKYNQGNNGWTNSRAA